MKSFYLESDINEIVEGLKKHRHLIDNKSFLIAGADGFLGKYFQAVLNKFDNVKLVCVDNHEPKLILPNVKYINHDITKPFDNLLKEEVSFGMSPYTKFDYVLAGASIASPKVYKQRPIECLDVGYSGLKNCIEIALMNNAKLLFFSSSEVYGTATQIPTPETYVGAIPSDNERSCYDLSKIVGSSLVHYYVKKKGLNASIVLPFNFYGPQITDGRVLPSFIHNLINRKPLEIFDNGEQLRCYTYITDGIIGCLLTLLIGGNGEKYNIGNPNTEISVKKLSEKIIEISEKATSNDIDYPDTYAGNGNPTKRVPDITKAEKEMEFKANVSLEDGLNRLIEWAWDNYQPECEFEVEKMLRNYFKDDHYVSKLYDRYNCLEDFEPKYNEYRNARSEINLMCMHFKSGIIFPDGVGLTGDTLMQKKLELKKEWENKIEKEAVDQIFKDDIGGF